MYAPRQVQLRTPRYKEALFPSDHKDRVRISHFNDCFLYGNDDHGTYIASSSRSVDDEKGELRDVNVLAVKVWLSTVPSPSII